MSDVSKPTATGGFSMITLGEFAGTGVQATDQGVAVAFTTKEGGSIDVTMSREQAKYLASELAKVTK